MTPCIQSKMLFSQRMTNQIQIHSCISSSWV